MLDPIAETISVSSGTSRPAEDRRSEISVVVPSFNRGGVIRRALSSILDQTLCPAEIIVVDDCSTDDTRRNVLAYGCELPLIYIRLRRNSGGGVARNIGVAAARGGLIAFLDSDDEWHPDHLRALLTESKGRSGDYLVGASALRLGHNPRVLPGRRLSRSASPQQHLDFILREALAFQTSTLLLPSQTARRFAFDTSLRRHQDWDLLFCLVGAGVPLTLLPRATVRYHPPTFSNVGVSPSIRPSLRFLIKHRARMDRKLRTRFVVLQIYRRQAKTGRLLVALLISMVLGALSPKECVFYLWEMLRTRRC